MTIANCPRCREQVSLPDNASREATVQCPFCSEEYSLEEALAKLPPMLVVVSDPESFDDPVVAASMAPASLVADEDDTPWSSLSVEDTGAGEEVTLAPIDDSPGAPFDFAGPSSDGNSKSTTSIRASARSRKPKGSPIKSVLSIVIGGLMAFPIAQLILWYLPGDLKRDFGAGPIVAQYIPAIVPAKFRGEAGPDDSSFSDASSQGFDPSSAFNFESDLGFGEDDEATPPANNKRKKRTRAQDPDGTPDAGDTSYEPEMSVDDAAAAGENVFGGDIEFADMDSSPVESAESAIELQPDPDPITPPMIEPDLSLDSEVEVNAVPTSDPEPTPLPDFASSNALDNSPAAKVSGLEAGMIRNPPNVASEQVAAAFRDALEGNLAWDTDAGGSPSSELKLQFYQSLSKLGETLTFVDKADEMVAEQLVETSRLLSEVGKQPDKLAIIKGVANGWMGRSREYRKTDGVCVCGVIKSITPTGELFESLIETNNKSITVVSLSDPTEHYAVGRDVLILGAIVTDPGRNLGGYAGDQKVVVLNGYHVAITKE